MLRAGKRLVFSKDYLKSQNGVLLSPVIDLCGLILRADRPVPELILNFLQSKGVLVTQVLYKNERCIRLSGHYEIKKSDCEKFIMENIALVNEQRERLESAPVAISLQNEITEKLDKISEPLSGIHEGVTYSLSGGVMFARGLFTAKSAMRDYNNSRCATMADMLVVSPNIHTEGQGNRQIGFFAERRAKQNLVCESEHGKQINAILDAGSTLTIKANSENYSTELLAIEEGVKWFNNPDESHDLLNDADDLLFKLRHGF